LKKKKPPSEGGFFFFKGWLLIAPPNARCAREAATRQPTLASSAGFFAVRSQEPPGLGGGGRGRRGRPGGRLGVIAGAARGGLRRCAWRAPALRVAGSGAARGGAQHVAGEGGVGCVNFEWGEGEVW